MLRKNLLLLRALPNSVIFNLKYFGLKGLTTLPVFVSHRTRITKLGGSVVINGKLKRGMVQIGFGDVAIFDKKGSRSVFKNEGTIIFEGTANIGHGTKIGVGKKGELYFGNNFLLTAESQIACKKKISFGKDCLVSWDVLIMDCDFHDIKNNDGVVLNPDKEIIIGDHVWIGARCMIKKGISIADGCIIASQSVIVKSILTPKQIWGGNPATFIKDDINWSK